MKAAPQKWRGLEALIPTRTMALEACKVKFGLSLRDAEFKRCDRVLQRQAPLFAGAE